MIKFRFPFQPWKNKNIAEGEGSRIDVSSHSFYKKQLEFGKLTKKDWKRFLSTLTLDRSRFDECYIIAPLSGEYLIKEKMDGEKKVFLGIFHMPILNLYSAYYKMPLPNAIVWEIENKETVAEVMMLLKDYAAKDSSVIRTSVGNYKIPKNSTRDVLTPEQYFDNWMTESGSNLRGMHIESGTRLSLFRHRKKYSFVYIPYVEKSNWTVSSLDFYQGFFWFDNYLCYENLDFLGLMPEDQYLEKNNNRNSMQIWKESNDKNQLTIEISGTAVVNNAPVFKLNGSNPIINHRNSLEYPFFFLRTNSNVHIKMKEVYACTMESMFSSMSDINYLNKSNITTIDFKHVINSTSDSIWDSTASENQDYVEVTVSNEDEKINDVMVLSEFPEKLNFKMENISGDQASSLNNYTSALADEVKFPLQLNKVYLHIDKIEKYWEAWKHLNAIYTNPDELSKIALFQYIQKIRVSYYKGLMKTEGISHDSARAGRVLSKINLKLGLSGNSRLFLNRSYRITQKDRNTKFYKFNNKINQAKRNLDECFSEIMELYTEDKVKTIILDANVNELNALSQVLKIMYTHPLGIKRANKYFKGFLDLTKLGISEADSLVSVDDLKKVWKVSKKLYSSLFADFAICSARSRFDDVSLIKALNRLSAERTWDAKKINEVYDDLYEGLSDNLKRAELIGVYIKHDEITLVPKYDLDALELKGQIKSQDLRNIQSINLSMHVIAFMYFTHKFVDDPSVGTGIDLLKNSLSSFGSNSEVILRLFPFLEPVTTTHIANNASHLGRILGLYSAYSTSISARESFDVNDTSAGHLYSVSSMAAIFEVLLPVFIESGAVTMPHVAIVVALVVVGASLGALYFTDSDLENDIESSYFGINYRDLKNASESNPRKSWHENFTLQICHICKYFYPIQVNDDSSKYLIEDERKQVVKFKLSIDYFDRNSFVVMGFLRHKDIDTYELKQDVELLSKSYVLNLTERVRERYKSFLAFRISDINISRKKIMVIAEDKFEDSNINSITVDLTSSEKYLMVSINVDKFINHANRYDSKTRNIETIHDIDEYISNIDLLVTTKAIKYENLDNFDPLISNFDAPEHIAPRIRVTND